MIKVPGTLTYEEVDSQPLKMTNPLTRKMADGHQQLIHWCNKRKVALKLENNIYTLNYK
jgi:hypothetical protein